MPDRTPNRGPWSSRLRRGRIAAIALMTVGALLAASPSSISAAAPPRPAPTLGTPRLCTPENEANCYGNSRAGTLSISPHIVHPGEHFTVDFSPVEGFHDIWDIASTGVPGAVLPPAGDCKAQERSCTFQVPENTVPGNTYVYYRLNFGTVQGPAYSISYLAVIGGRALSGSVLTPAGQGVQGAELSLQGPDGEETATTDGQGAYAVLLPAATYNVAVVVAPGADQSPKVSACSGRIEGPECIVDLSASDGTASFTEGGVTVTDVEDAQPGAASGPVSGNTPITITGSGFGQPGSADIVKLVPVDGGAPVDATHVMVLGDKTIRAVTQAVPPEALAALGNDEDLVTDVEVTVGGVTSSANPPADEFTYERPKVDRITPDTLSPAGGTVATIDGDGFGGADDLVSVRFCPLGPTAPDDPGCEYGLDKQGGQRLRPDSATRITVVAPSWDVPDRGATTTVDLFVTVYPRSGGTEDSAPVGAFFGVAVTGIDPPSAAPGGGTMLTVSGYGFGGPTNHVEVEFCAPGDVTDNARICPLGEDGGGRHKIVPDSDGVLHVIAPAEDLKEEQSADINVYVDVFKAGSDHEVADGLPFLLPYRVTVTGVDPPTGSPVGGTELTITGSGFGGKDNHVGVDFCGLNDSGQRECLYGRDARSGRVKFSPTDDKTIHVYAPAFAIRDHGSTEPVTVFVVVDNEADDIEYAASNEYNWSYSLSVGTLDPVGGSPAGGTDLQIKGSGFGALVDKDGTPVDDAVVEFCTPGTQRCNFGEDADGRINIAPDSDDLITVMTPPWHIPPSTIDPTAAAGSGEDVNVDVELYADVGGGRQLVGQAVYPDEFSYALSVSGIRPAATASAAGGTELTIEGGGFGSSGDGRSVRVLFDFEPKGGGAPIVLAGTHAEVLTDTGIRVDAPAVDLDKISSTEASMYVQVLHGGNVEGEATPYPVQYLP